MKVGVGALAVNERGEILLVRRRNPPEAGSWSIPGGGAEEEEAPDESVLRELREETGLVAVIDRYLGSFIYRVPSDRHESVAVIFEVKVVGTMFNAAPSENIEVAWFHRGALPRSLAVPAAFALKRTDRVKPLVRDGAPVGRADVVLVAPFFPLADREALSLPLGLASIHSLLACNGFLVRSFDCSLASDYLDFITQLAHANPKIVGVQFHSDMSWSWAIRACRSIRRKLPNSIIVGGGELASARAEFLISSKCVDLVVCDEGEMALLEIAEAYRRDSLCLDAIPGLVIMGSSGEVERTANRPMIERLDILPMPAIEGFRWQEYGQWSIFTSRGCPFRCTYCSSAAFWRHSIRYHSPERVIDEMARMVEKYGAQDIYIADDTFTLDSERVIAICRGLRMRRLAIRWSCLTRVDMVDRRLLEEMHAGGCCLISFGVETSSNLTLNSVRKSTRFEVAQRTLRLCQEVGIRTRISLILGLPGEGKSEVLQTLDLIRQTHPNEIQLYGLTPHDGTALFGNLSQMGVRIIETDRDLWSRDVLRPVCETDLLSSSDIIELAKQFISDLQADGYVYLTEEMEKRKLGLDKTIATAFAPVQVIGGVF